MKSDREVRLERALGTLIRKYWLNKGTDSEFIQVITPKSIPDYWRAADEALSERRICEYEGCDQEAFISVGERWVCKEHMDREFKRVGSVIETLVRNLLGVKQ